MFLRSPSVLKSLDEFKYVSPDVQFNIPEIPVQYRDRDFNKDTVTVTDTGQLSDLRSDSDDPVD